MQRDWTGNRCDTQQQPSHQSLTLQQTDHSFPHAHVHVSLGCLEVVVQVVAEPREERYGLLLPAPVEVLREDHCRKKNRGIFRRHART